MVYIWLLLVEVCLFIEIVIFGSLYGDIFLVDDMCKVMFFFSILFFVVILMIICVYGCIVFEYLEYFVEVLKYFVVEYI